MHLKKAIELDPSDKDTVYVYARTLTENFGRCLWNDDDDDDEYRRRHQQHHHHCYYHQHRPYYDHGHPYYHHHKPYYHHHFSMIGFSRPLR